MTDRRDELDQLDDYYKTDGTPALKDSADCEQLLSDLDESHQRLQRCQKTADTACKNTLKTKYASQPAVKARLQKLVELQEQSELELSQIAFVLKFRKHMNGDAVTTVSLTEKIDSSKALVADTIQNIKYLRVEAPTKD